MSRAVLLYDRDCGLCRAATGLVLAWDRRRALRPVAIQDPEAESLLSGTAPERRLDSWHLVPDSHDRPDVRPCTPSDGREPESGFHRVFSAGSALAPLLRLLRDGGTLEEE